jgi:hypothetical protein
MEKLTAMLGLTMAISLGVMVLLFSIYAEESANSRKVGERKKGEIITHENE